MKTVLITGGAGFIGSHIAEHFLKTHKVRVLDNLSSGRISNILHIQNHTNFEFMHGDITDLDICRKACKNIDIVCHQAAIGSVPRSIDDPLTSHKSNIDGFLNILIASKENNIKRVVYASSSSVYGDNNDLPKTENKIGKQLSPYAITKYVDELYGRIFTELYGMECIGLRYFNVFGPRQNPNGFYAAVIPKFVSLLQKGESPIINGTGTYSRDFTYVDNVVSANYLALTTENSECFGEVINIGNGGRVTIIELYNKIKEELKSDTEPIFGKTRQGDIAHSNANIDKATKLLGYKPCVNFDEGIHRTVAHFKCM